jgi:dihydrofolate reductase
MGVSIIVAVASNGAIGKDNQLLWHLPADMKFFRDKTTGHHVITGRKNYESIPEKFRPLPNRTNIVLSRDADYIAPGALLYTNLKEAVQFAISTGDEEVFIIGGGNIYKQALEENLADKMYITKVKAEFDADTWFPGFNADKWSESLLLHHPADEKNPFEFEIWEYIKK